MIRSAIAMVLALPSVAHAGGFELWEGSPDQNAAAYAGQASKAWDAGTAWTNPAGMVRIGGSEIDSSVDFIDPDFRFTGANSNFPDPAAAGAAARNVGAIDGAATAATFNVVQLGPDLAAGLAIKSPFGARIDYPQDWVGRYQSLVSFLTDIQAEPSLAYAITPDFSIGGGPVIDYLSLRETEAVRPMFGFQYGDILADVHGSDVAFGYSFGALWQSNAATRLGLTYRSRIEHRVDIRQTLAQSQGLLQSPLGPLIASLLRQQNTPGYLYAKGHEKFNLPDNVDASITHELSSEWSLMGEAIWTHWQVFNNITVVTENGNRPIVSQFGFHNAIFASLGAAYRPVWQKRLLLQAGAGFDQNPFDAAQRQAQIPTDSRVLLGLGASCQINRSTSLGFGYNHYFGLTSTIAATGPTLANNLQLPAGLLTGQYRNQIDTFSAGLKLRF